MDKPAVLLLERDANVIEIAQHCLADEVELHVANTVDLATRITARRPVVVAILDATMAGLIPTDTVAKLRGQRPGLRIVFLAEPAFDLDKRYAQLGSVLRKPVTLERLADAIRNALRLRNMSDGVQRMRSSSGTYPAVRLPDLSNGLPASPSVLPASPSAPPPGHSSPPPAEPPGEGPTERRDSGTIERGRDGDEPPPRRSVTPRPFARVR